jgi:hypothetical protein
MAMFPSPSPATPGTGSPPAPVNPSSIRFLGNAAVGALVLIQVLDSDLVASAAVTIALVGLLLGLLLCQNSEKDKKPSTV